MRKIYLPLVVWFLILGSVLGTHHAKAHDFTSLTDELEQVDQTASDYVSYLTSFPLKSLNQVFAPMRMAVGPIDAQANALLSPSLPGCLTAAEDVILQIENVGTSTIDFSVDTLTLTVEISGPVSQNFSIEFSTDSLPVGSTADLLITSAADLSVGGTYTLLAYLSIGADTTLSNDTIGTNLVVSPALGPVVGPVDFDGYTGINLNALFPDWLEWDGANQPGNPTPFSAWTRDDFGNDLASPNGDAARINIWSTNVTGWIIGPKFVPDPNTVLTYDVALTTFSGTASSNLGSDDTAGVYISTDCGLSFSPARLYTSTSTISNTGQADSIDLSSFAGQEIIVAFYGNSGTVNDPEDNNFYIDNVNIRPIVALDGRLSGIIAPELPRCLTNAEEISLTFENAGTDPLSLATDSLTLTVDINGPIPQNFSTTINSGTIPSGLVLDFVVTVMADFSAPGTYTITGYIDIDNDNIGANDTLVTTLVNAPSVGTNVGPVDFATFNGGNLSTAFPGWVEWDGEGQPTVPNPTADWSSVSFGNDPANPNGLSAAINIWTTGQFGWILSPKFTADTNSILTYDLALTPFFSSGTASLGSDDTAGVFVSTDCGESFTMVKFYNSASTISNTGQSDTVDLSLFAGQEIIIAFYGTSGVTADPEDNYFFIDNVNIKTLFPIDGSANTLVEPTVPQCLGSTEAITIRIQNDGSSAIDFAVDTLELAAVVTGPIAQSFSATFSSGVLAPGASADYTITTAADFSAVGTYEVRVALSIDSDPLQANDTATFSIVNEGSVGPTIGPIDFAGYDFENLNAVVPGWFEWDGEGQPSVKDPTTPWQGRDFGDDPGHPNGNAASFNIWNSGNFGWIVGPKFTPDSNTIMTYEVSLDPFFGSGPTTLGSDDSVGVYVSTNCGESFALLRLYDTNSTILNTGQTDTVDLGPYAEQEIIVAFYATSGVTFDNNDNNFHLDNINTRQLLKRDVSSSELVLPALSSCGDSMVFGELVIINSGSDSQNEIPWEVTVVAPDGTLYSYGDTLRGAPALTSGGVDTVLFGPFNSYAGGTFSITATTQLGQDQDLANDSIMAQAIFESRAAPAVEAFDPACLGEVRTLSISNARSLGASYEWSLITGMDTIVVDTGLSLTTPPVLSTSTYIINEIQDSISAGVPDSSIGTGGAYSFESGLVFDAFVDFTLESVTVYPTTPGLITIELRDASGTVILSSNVALINTSGPQVVQLGWNIPEGSDYTIFTPVPTGDMFRNTSGAQYPYEVPGVLSIKETALGNGASGFYYFYYDWKVTIPLCDRGLGVVRVELNDSTSSSFATTILDENQVDIQDLSTGADSVKYLFGDGDSSTISGVHTYPAPGPYTVTQIAYGPCNNDTTIQKVDVICSEPTAGYTWVLDPSDPDNITVVFTSIATGADSVSYLLPPNISSDVPSFSFTFPGTGEYVVEMSSFNVCGSATYTDTISIIQTGLGSYLDMNSLKLYPNPSKGEFQLEFELLQVADVSIEVLDMRGRLMQNLELDKANGSFAQSFNLKDAPDGVYLVKVMIADEVFIRKIQVE